MPGGIAGPLTVHISGVPVHTPGVVKSVVTLTLGCPSTSRVIVTPSAPGLMYAGDRRLDSGVAAARATEVALALERAGSTNVKVGFTSPA